MTTKQVGVSVSVELYEAMHKVEGVNWSALARRAFKEELNILDGKEGVVQRLAEHESRLRQLEKLIKAHSSLIEGTAL